MMRPFPSSVLIATGLASLLACQAAPPERPRAEAGPVVAEWAGAVLTAGDVRAEMAKVPAVSRASLAELEGKRKLVDRMITNRLLYEEGRRRGYADDPEIVRQLDALRERLVVQRLMRDLRQRPAVSEEEARRYYEENRPLYSTTRVRASHILLGDEATAKVVQAEAAAHPDRFPALAREKSTDQTSAKRGGDLGMFGAGRMVPEFERAAFALRVGEVSPPVKTHYGWHVILVTDRREGETRPFDAVASQITTLLANQKLEAQVEAAVAKLRSEARIRIDEERLRALEPPAGAAPSPHGPMAGH